LIKYDKLLPIEQCISGMFSQNCGSDVFFLISSIFHHVVVNRRELWDDDDESGIYVTEY